MTGHLGSAECSVMPPTLMHCGTVARQVLCPWGFSSPGHWSGLSCPSSQGYSQPRDWTVFPTLQILRQLSYWLNPSPPPASAELAVHFCAPPWLHVMARLELWQRHYHYKAKNSYYLSFNRGFAKVWVYFRPVSVHVIVSLPNQRDELILWPWRPQQALSWQGHLEMAAGRPNQGALELDIDVPLPNVPAASFYSNLSHPESPRCVFPKPAPWAPVWTILPHHISSSWDYGSRITVTGYARSHLEPGLLVRKAHWAVRGGVCLRYSYCNTAFKKNKSNST